MKDLLEQLLAGNDLSTAQAEQLLGSLAPLSVPESMAAAVLVALRAKGETGPELAGLARGMQARARRPAIDVSGDPPVIDIVGTGGDQSGSYNISTGAALLSAACGLRVVKHGNRSVSSRCGSADVLEALGLPVPMDERHVEQCMAATGFAFLFAPHYHPATAAVSKVRRELGVRTAFNMLGPLTNPARPPFGVIGACSTEAAMVIAQAFSLMPITRVFVVHGASSWDEPTPFGPFELFDVRPGAIRAFVRDPAAAGVQPCSESDLLGGDAACNAAALLGALAGEARYAPLGEALVLGAALGLEVCGRVESMADGVAAARRAISIGEASAWLARLAAFGASCHQDKQKGVALG